MHVPLPQLQVPFTFDSLEHYIGVFEPLLHEEARESLRNNLQEAVSAGRLCTMAQAIVLRWYVLVLEVRYASVRQTFRMFRRTVKTA